MSTPSVGTPLPRIDGRAKVTGAARYAAEFNQPGQAHAVMLTSTAGRGRIIAIDARDAVRLPGVLAVVSHLNAPRLPYREHKASIDPAAGERLHVLEDAEVRFFGQPVAVVVAETLQQAQHAAEAVRITYEPRRPAVRLDGPENVAIVPAAMRPGARTLADTSRGDAERRSPKRP